jgi:hypothetical protein
LPKLSDFAYPLSEYRKAIKMPRSLANR